MAESERTVEDRLREEYFRLLPEIRRVTDQLEAEVRYHVLPISRSLSRHERLVVKCRVKGCESALEKLRARQEGAVFSRSRPEVHSLTTLNDLAGVRVLAFPRSRLAEIDRKLREVFPIWNADPIEDEGEVQALKYYGYCEGSDRVRGEYQIVSMLTGLFWEVEHSAIYKPDPRLGFVAQHRGMQERTRDVMRALGAFEELFEALARQD